MSGTRDRLGSKIITILIIIIIVINYNYYCIAYISTAVLRVLTIME